MSAVLRRAFPELVSGLSTILAFCAAGAVRGTYPFGGTTRSTGDLGTQILPMHTLARDVLTGEAPGDLFLNWTSALGVPFLPDVGTYLGSPLTALVVLFPRDRVDLAVFVITLVKLAAAAAFMTRYLRSIRSGPALGAAALGTAYGLCGWAMDDGAYVPMWLDGFAALPLLALVGEWVIRRDHLVLAPLVVALAWVSNFYTAYMATIGAGLLVLARLIVLRSGLPENVLTLVRLGGTVLLGLLLAAPLLVPVVSANRLAQPSPSGVFTPAGWQDVLARLLPATEGVGTSPSLFVTTPALLLALALPWHRGVALRVRIVYVAGLVLLVLSLLWAPTHQAWHGFDVPNGSPYRQAFVVCAWTVVAAWLALRQWPGAVAVVAAATGYVVVAQLGMPSHQTSTATVPTFALTAAASAVLLAGPALRLSSSAVRWRWVGVALIAVVVVEGTVNAVVVDAMRQPRLGSAAPWSDHDAARRDAVLAADDWPRYRTTPGGTLSLPNDPMLIGGQGRSYYSSLMPAATSEALRRLGVPWAGYGRSVADVPDEGLDALVGVGARVHAGGPGAVEARQSPAAPVVVLHREFPATVANPYLQRNALLAHDVYTVPTSLAALPDGTLLRPRSGDFVLPDVEGASATVTAECPAGSRVLLSAPVFVGTVALAGNAPRAVLGPGRTPGVVRGAGPVDLGEAPQGTFEITLTGVPGGRLPVDGVGCLDRSALAAAVSSLGTQGATVTAGGHGFSVTWPEPSDGVAVATVTRVRGWQCSSGAAWATPGTAAGFIAVPMQGSNNLECRFRPPGLRLGLGLGAIGIAGVGLSLLVARRGLRRLAVAPDGPRVGFLHDTRL